MSLLLAVLIFAASWSSADVIPAELSLARSVETSGNLQPTTTAPRTGTLGYALPKHGSRYLAIPEKRGTVVTICGPAACLVRASTDVGPDLAMQRAGRIADVSSVDFPVLCGKPLTAGLCSGSYTVGGTLRLPDTSTQP